MEGSLSSSPPPVLAPCAGKPVAWKLMPQQAPLLLAADSSSISQRGTFATRNLWVTPHADAEAFPAGNYTIQSKGGEGLKAWTAANRSLGGADPVIWHCFGATHIPRVEDFPVMPCEVVGECRPCMGGAREGGAGAHSSCAPVWRR